MNLQNWISEAKAHWKEWRPREFKALQKEGRLEPALMEAAERTFNEMQELMKSGYQEHEAWEIVRQEYLFTPPENPPKEEPPASEAVRLSQEINHLKNSLLGMHPET